MTLRSHQSKCSVYLEEDGLEGTVCSVLYVACCFKQANRRLISVYNCEGL